MPIDISDLGVRNDPSQPVRTALAVICADNWNRAEITIKRATDLVASGETSAVKNEMRKARALLEEGYQVLTWIMPPRERWTQQEALDWYMSMSLPGNVLEPVYEALQKKEVGRPHNKLLYVEAFELMLRSKEMTHGRIVRMLCPCGMKKHDAKCEHHFKAGIRSL